MAYATRVSVLSALGLLAAGCGAPESEPFVIPEGRVTVAAEPASAPSEASASETPAEVAVQAADAGLTEFPENTPEDLPRYPGMKVHSVNVTPEPFGIIYQAEVTVGTVGAMAWFSGETERLGWKRKDGMTQPEFAYASYEKDGRTMNVNINSGDPQTGTGTVLTVIYAE